jgi:hypothetical protein
MIENKCGWFCRFNDIPFSLFTKSSINESIRPTVYQVVNQLWSVEIHYPNDILWGGTNQSLNMAKE